MKYKIFGDTGGHGGSLMNSLQQLGLNRFTLELPKDVTIIHMGDLIHKGPLSNELVTVVNQIIKRNPGQWIQLLGNHEFQHIPGAPYFWKCDCSDETILVLRSWYDSGEAKVTHAIKNACFIEGGIESDFLFSHAGLTKGFFDILKIEGKDDVETTSEYLNSIPTKQITRPGDMLVNPHTGRKRNPLLQVGPVWASSTSEVWPTWNRAHREYGEEMPFSQFYGHTTSWQWMSDKWYPTVPQLYRESTRLIKQSRVTVTPVGDKFLMGCDPGFSNKIDLLEQPYSSVE